MILKNHIKHLTLLLAILSLVTQTHNANARQAWLIQTRIPDDVNNPVTVLLGEEMQTITLSNRLASGPIPIPTDGVIRLIQELPENEKTREKKHNVLSQTRIPDNVDNALIILSPDTGSDREHTFFRSRMQDLNQFQGGNILYLNMTNFNIGIEIGDERLALRPGSSRIHSGINVSQATSVPYRYSYHNDVDNQWRVISASMTIAVPTRREIKIFAANENTGNVRLSAITFPVN